MYLISSFLQKLNNLLKLNKLIFSILILSIYFNSCQRNENSIVEPADLNKSTEYSALLKSSTDNFFDFEKIPYYKSKYGMDDVEEIALYLAKSLKDKSLRKIFKKAKNASYNTEQILEASTFLNFEFTDEKNNNAKISFLEKLLKHTDAKNKDKFKSKIENLEFGIFDIYFPFKEHRNNWNEDQELLVAVVNSCIAKGEEKILAFNTNGEEIYLNPKEVPAVPTLVVCPSEKYGNYEIAAAPPPPPPPSSTHFLSTLNTLYVEEQFDGGFCGTEMEIRFDYRFSPDGGQWWSNWQNTGHYNMLPGIALSNINATFIDYFNSNYMIQMNIYENDDFLCGSDDPVAVGAWDNLHWWVNSGSGLEWSLIGTSISSINYLTPRIYRVQNDTEGSGHNVQVHFKFTSY